MSNTELIEIQQAMLKPFITVRKRELERLRVLWTYVEELHVTVGLMPETFADIRAKVSSRMAQCEISIRDHEKLLQ